MTAYLAWIINKAFVCFLWIYISGICGKRSETVRMPGSLCGSVLGDISGVDLRSSHYPRLQTCAITLVAGGDDATVHRKFLITFHSFSLNECDVILTLFGAKNMSHQLLTKLTCQTPKPTTSVTSGRFLTLVLDNRKLHGGFSFQITITAVSEQPCFEFPCSDGYCIDNDLLCDGTKHCLDGSDEADFFPSQCSSWTHVSSTAYTVFRVGVGAVVGLVVTVLLSCVIVTVVFLVWYRRKVNEYRRIIQTSQQEDSGQEIRPEDDTSSDEELTAMYPFPGSAAGPPTYSMDTINDYGSTAKVHNQEETSFSVCRV